MTDNFKPNPHYDRYIEERGPYQYRVRFRKKGYPKTSQTFSSRKIAEEYVAEIDLKRRQAPNELEEKHRQLAVAKKTRVADLITGYRDQVIEPKAGKDTEYYRLSAMLDMPIAAVSVAELNKHHIMDYRNDRLDEDLAPSTVKRELAVLSSVFSHAAREWKLGDVLSPNPASAKLVRYPKDSEPRSRRLVDDEEDRLLTACKAAHRSPWLEKVFVLAIETAMRQGEIRSIEWKDVHFLDYRSYIYIPKAKSTKKITKPRSVPMTPVAEAALRAQYEYLQKRCKRLGSSLPKYVFAFWNKEAGDWYHLSKTAVNNAWQKARAAAGVVDLRFHDLRHEGTSRFFERHNLTMMEVMTATGHAHSTMTERYTHLSAQKVSEKIRRRESSQGKMPIETFLHPDQHDRLSSIADSHGFSEGELVELLLTCAVRQMETA